MDAATLQARINAGNGKAAARLGFSFDVYRPASDTANPIVPGNKITTLPAAFASTGTGFNFEKPSLYTNPVFNGLFDATLVRVGDYLVNVAHGTYFVAQLADIVPHVAVQCNRIITVLSPGTSKTYGAQSPYSGTTPATETQVLTSYPASLIFDARGKASDVKLPLDLPAPNYQILAPVTLAADLRSGMIINDDNNRRYIISATEDSPMGWRIWAQQAVT
jgi:hypothetical protein